jgi:RecJ-like exonuclease
MKENNFMIRSETLERLKPKINEAIELIKNTIDEKRPVWIRHHADCDGYCGAVSLERVILKKLYKVHRRESDMFHYFHRYPSKTPFYDYSDAIKDLTNMLSEINRFEQKKPLIIVVDNGSSREDTLALKRLKVYNVQIIVIDHHPVEPENNIHIDIHINPLLFDSDPRFTAGMMCAEIAHIFDIKEEGLELLAALAGIADRAESTEIEEYIKLAEKKNFTKDDLSTLAEVVDFETYNIGYMESRYLVNDLLFSDLEKQKKIISILKHEITQRKEKMLSAIKRYVKYDDYGIYILSKLAVDEITHAGEYPMRGKTTSIAKDYLQESLKKPIIMLGYDKTFITFRISEDLTLDMNQICTFLEKKLPYSLIYGGGHPKAGTIRFNPASADEILQSIEEFIHNKLKPK